MSIWLFGISCAFIERVTAGYHTRYHTCNHTFMEILHHFNYLLLTVHQKCYSMPSNTSWVKYVLSCQFSNAIPRFTISFFEKILIYFFFKNCDDNALKIIQICTYFTENNSKAYSSRCSNELIIVVRWKRYKTPIKVW